MNQQLIADRLKISPATVSRALANHPAISAETRAIVKRIAIEMGYRGNPVRNVRRPRQSKPITIGVLIGVPAKTVALATFPFVLQGIREQADLDHVSVDICYQPPAELSPDARRLPVFRHIRNGDWRGLVLIYPFSDEAVDTIATKISTVAVLESYPHPHVDTIDTDDFSGIRAMVHQLAAVGHHRIGFVAWRYPIGGHWITRRFGGYVDGLFSLGLPFNPDWAFNVRRDAATLLPGDIAAFVARKIREEGVTGWVCAADHQAYQLVQDLRVHGIRVPEDCSVTGFDGLEAPAGLQTVTSMRVPHAEIGASAVSRLLGRMIHPHSPRRKILVEGQIVAGETIAAPVLR